PHRTTMLQISRTTRASGAKDLLVILADPAELRNLDLERNDRQYLAEQLQDGQLTALCDISGRLVMVHQVRPGDRSRQLEQARRAGTAMLLKLAEAKREEALAVSLHGDAEATLALLEGATLGAYRFTRHKPGEQPRSPKKLALVASEVKPAALEELHDLC